MSVLLPARTTKVLFHSPRALAPNAVLMAELAVRMGITLVHAENDEAALAALHDGVTSLVIVNAAAPTQACCDLLLAIRGLAAHHETPLLVLVPSLGQSPLNRALEDAALGNVDVLVGALEPSLLRTRVATLLKQQAREAALSLGESELRRAQQHLVPCTFSAAPASLLKIVQLSHKIEDDLGRKMTSESLRDMGQLRACVAHVTSLIDATP